MRPETYFSTNSLRTLRPFADVCGRCTSKRPGLFGPVNNGVSEYLADVADVKRLSLTTRGYVSHIYPYKDLPEQTSATYATSAECQFESVRIDFHNGHRSGSSNNCAGDTGDQRRRRHSNQPVDKANASVGASGSPFQGRKTRHPSGLWAAIAPRQISGRFRANNGSFRRKFRPNGHTERPPCYSEFVSVRGGRSGGTRGPPGMSEETFS